MNIGSFLFSTFEQNTNLTYFAGNLNQGVSAETSVEHSNLLDLTFIWPELYFLTMILFIFTYGIFMKSSKFNFNISKEFSLFTIISIFYTLLLCLNNLNYSDRTLFQNLLVIDFTSTWIKVILLLASIVVLIISSESLNKSRLGCFEFFILYSICVFGTLIFVSSIDLFCLFLALEVQSISFYALVALNRNSEYCAEAGIKYFILGAFTAGIFLFGLSLIYSSTGTTSMPDLFHILRGLSLDLDTTHNGNFEYFVSDNFRLLLGLIFILIGFLFKVTAVPFHMWAPDIYEGAPFVTVVFISTIPKIAVLFILMKLSAIYLISFGFIWKYIFISSGLLSIIIGTLFALRQFKVRRFLAYSSITHMGFILLSLSTGTFEGIKFAFSYLLIYLISLLNMWAIISMLEHSYNCRIDSLLDLGGVFYKNKLLGANFVINLFSLAGLPPFVGFYAKLYVLTTLVSSAYYTITLVCVLASLFSIYYYIKVVKVILFDSKIKILSNFTRISYLQSFVINFLLIMLVIFFYIPGVHTFLESFTQQMFLF